MTENEREYFKRRRVRVTNRYLETRYKDEALDPSQSIRIGRDPLWIAASVCIGLIVFAYQFGDLLWHEEQVMLVAAGLAIGLLGFCTASLQIGQYMQERTVMWGPIWTISAVRRAIFEANHDRREMATATAVVPTTTE